MESWATSDPSAKPYQSRAVSSGMETANAKSVEWVARAFIEWRGPAVIQLLRAREEAAVVIGATLT